MSSFIFITLLVVAGSLFYKNIVRIKRNIQLGKDDLQSDQPDLRTKNLLLLAFGQKKMFKNPTVAILHFILYAGFIIINLEVLEIVLDGTLSTHRILFPILGFAYSWLINIFELLAALVLVACIVFLWRRNIGKVKRLVSADLNGWPKSDANFILITEIVLMSLFLLMNAADAALQQKAVEHYNQAQTGSFIVSGLIEPLLTNWSTNTLIAMERTCWWLHIIGILAFLNYLPYSKHLHIILAFPNAYYARLNPSGKMTNMPEIQQEVLYAMQPELATNSTATAIGFGAKDVFDLGRKNLLDAYSCTECGRCTAACPANITGKLLSPRAIMMKTRDRLEEVGKNIAEHGDFEKDNKTLLHDYISVEELRACTTCYACVEECPVSISPVDIILQMRRHLIMEESNAPSEWNATFSNIENNFAPWKFSPDERTAWMNG